MRRENLEPGRCAYQCNIICALFEAAPCLALYCMLCQGYFGFTFQPYLCV